MELQSLLADAIVAIWNARDRANDETITGFGLVLSHQHGATRPCFIVARTPTEGAYHYWHAYGIDKPSYDAMCEGRSPSLYVMQSESWGGAHLQELRGPVARLTIDQRRTLGVAALRRARDRMKKLGLRPLFLWLDTKADPERTRDLALELNEPAQLAGWLLDPP